MSLRLWALSCLQRSGAVEVMGFHPSTLFNNGSENVVLKEILETRGYSGIMEELELQGINKFKPLLIVTVNDSGEC